MVDPNRTHTTLDLADKGILRVGRFRRPFDPPLPVHPTKYTTIPIFGYPSDYDLVSDSVIQLGDGF